MMELLNEFISGTACDSFFSYLADDILPCLRLGIV